MKKIIQTILATALIFTLFSCTNILERNSDLQENKSADGETYLIIGATNIKKTTSRSIGDPTYSVNPDKNDAVPSKLTNLILTGREINSTSTTMATLAETDTLEELLIQKIKIQPGAWIFKLSAEIDGIIYSSDNVEQTIYEGQYNTVKFILNSEAKYGGLEISVEWKNIANKVVATLMDATETETVATKTFTDFNPIDDTTSSITFGRDIKKDEEQIPSGTYYLKFEFYNDTTPNATDVFDYYDAYINIADGLTTRSTFEIELKKTFEIQYEANGGSLAEGETQPKKYSLKSSDLLLPVMKKPGYFWGGWYEDEDLSGEPVTTIPAGTGVQKTYYAKWNEPVLYVSGTGDDPTGDGTEANPFESIDKACEKIIETGDSEMDWVIYIMGDVTGPHEGTRKAGSRNYSSDYGRSIIPAEITQEHAKSILLMGKNDSGETAGVPNTPTDMINRGLSSSSNSDTGSALVIATAVPVKVENLLIKNGCNKPANSSSDPYSEKGGGLFITSEATVSLGDGVIISNNNAKTAGGGIYNAGTLFINGSAEISSNNCDDGGGIYNTGHLYLGYEDTTTEKEWTSSIKNNTSWRGAGIKNLANAELVMNSGSVNHNSCANNSNTSGGGIWNMGSFTMTNGVIEFNDCCQGGGVYNGYSNASEFGTFTFSGGKIKNNFANYVYGTNVSNGGGIYNTGVTYIYGEAIIGDETASALPTDNTGAQERVIANTSIDQTCSNLALGLGGGIYVGAQGKLFLGYSRYVDATDNTPAVWNKGIYYNYAKKGGGGIAYGSSAKAVIFNSGTVSFNGAASNGAAAYIGADGFILGGTATIPSGNEEGSPKQTVHVRTNNFSLNIDNDLSHLDAGAIALLPQDNSNSSNPIASSYNTYKPLIVLTDAAEAAGVTIDVIKNKFTVESFTNPTTGIVTNWEVSSEGKAQQKTENLTVSATGTYQSIAAAVATMNDASKDYVITLDGEITGAQTIEGLSGEEIKANSITIKGKSSSSSNLSDIINASGGTGSALSINTRVPVTLSYIAIKGGCAVNGGGLFLGEGATAYLTNYTTIKENTNYSAGVNTAGKGGGVYISNDAKMIINSVSKVCDNTGTRYGAGIYVADGGYLRMLENSESHVSYNKFISGSDQVMGGGIYLEDGAVMEHEGGYIHDNEVNADGLATGVYVNSSAIYKTMRYARLTYQNDNVPNDIYLAGDAKIELLYTMYNANSYIRRITLQNYEENKELFTLASGVSPSIDYMSYFDVTTQTLANGQKQYWAIEKNTGKLIKSSGMGITVSIPSGPQNDIQIEVTLNGEPVENNTHLTGGSELVFTVTDADNYEEFEWTVDGDKDNAEYAPSFTFDTSGYPKGVYVVYLEAKDSTGNYYSYTAQVKVE